MRLRVAIPAAILGVSLVVIETAARIDNAAQDDPTNPIRMLLDDFHDAASKAEFERYIGHMAPTSFFIGTDAMERWDKDEFAAFVKPYFEKGTGWTYTPRDRQVHFVGQQGDVAMFDELLDNAKYGECRGTGVLVKAEAGEWKIAQYALTIPVPNDVAAEVVALIRDRGR